MRGNHGVKSMLPVERFNLDLSPKGYTAISLWSLAGLYILPGMLSFLPVAMQVFLSALVMLAGLLFILQLCGQGNILNLAGWQKLRVQDLPAIIKGALAAVFITPLINALWIILLRLLQIPYSEIQPLMKTAVTLPVGSFILVVFTVTVLVPMAEEILFRRVIFGWLTPLGKYTAVIAASMIFAAAHFYLAGVAGLFFLGLLMQIFYCRSGNIAVPAAIHAVFNLVSILVVRCCS